MKLPFRWVRKRMRFQTGESLYLNKICVGEYSWNSGRTQGDKDETTVWVGSIALPSLTDATKRVYGSCEAEVRQRVEQIVSTWFDYATKEVTK